MFVIGQSSRPSHTSKLGEVMEVFREAFTFTVTTAVHTTAPTVTLSTPTTLSYHTAVVDVDTYPGMVLSENEEEGPDLPRRP